jgi:hypothetical protein
MPDPQTVKDLPPDCTAQSEWTVRVDQLNLDPNVGRLYVRKDAPLITYTKAKADTLAPIWRENGVCHVRLLYIPRPVWPHASRVNDPDWEKTVVRDQWDPEVPPDCPAPERVEDFPPIRS